MKGLALEDLNIDEDRYQEWKANRETERAKKKAAQEPTPTVQTHIPINPQEIIDTAARRIADARAEIHVEAQTTQDVFAHIDELLKAS